VAERFPVETIPREIRAIAERLREAGHEAWYVGGAVRDELLRQLHGRAAAPGGDFDIATSALPEQVQGLFRRTVPIGLEHGTVAVLDNEGGAHEVTTFRRDVRTDGRHAVVEFGASVDEDLARRDFTINAVAVHPETGEIRDPFGGRADIAAQRLRAVGEPALRLREDRLRVLRALRFAATLRFTVDEATWEAVRAASGELGQLSRERVRDEWLKTLKGAPPSAALGWWRRAGVLGAVWPELAALKEDADALLDGLEDREAVLVTAAALFHAGQSAEGALAAVLRLRFSNREAERVRATIAGWADPPPGPEELPRLRRWLARHRAAWTDVLAGLEPGSLRAPLRAAIARVLDSHAPLSVAELAVRGDDLRAAGLAPGPTMGTVLRKLLEEVLDDPTRNTREHLLARARELA
jgi:tRNA nucleotidyltransferase (CCA-adding enzyme)